MAATDQEAARTRVLDAAEALFYARGVQSVGMDEVRTASGVSLKRLYQLFPSKGELLEAYLRRRDTRWLDSLARYVAMAEADPRRRPAAVFDWLYAWFAEPDFHGCAFVNAFGELGATSPAVARAVADHKQAFRAYLSGVVDAAGGTEAVALQLALLAEGAMTTAAISGTPLPARQAGEAGRVLLSAAGATAVGEGA